VNSSELNLFLDRLALRIDDAGINQTHGDALSDLAKEAFSRGVISSEVAHVLMDPSAPEVVREQAFFKAAVALRSNTREAAKLVASTR
jgi:hypothetical protein